MTDPPTSRFLQLLEEKKAALGPAAAEPQPTKEDYDPDLVPDVSVAYEVSAADEAIDHLLEGLTIIDSYNKWCGKSIPQIMGRTEGIKVSCPNPAHPDKNPSAWLNTKKGVWNCGSCEIGGDQYDIAAYHFGFPVPGYKTTNFRELRTKMAESLGYRVESAPGISYLVQDEDTESPAGDTQDEEPVTETGDASSEADNSGQQADEAQPTGPESGKSDAGPIASVIQLYGDEDTDDEIDLPELPWRPLVQEGTFLYEWMKATEIDDIPDEYYFWNGMLALGLAIGRDTTLYDRRPVFGNLFVCIVGPTGSGKSQAEGHLNELLRIALPYDHADPFSKGIQMIASPASGESIVWSFQKDIVDPSTAKTLSVGDVRGLISYNELSGLTGRATRAGNTIKSTLMELYDCSGVVSTRSRVHGTTSAKNPFASLLTTTQPKSMGHLLTGSDIDAGFVNRFLFVSGKPKRRMAIGGEQILVTASVKPIQEVRAWSGKTKQVQWSKLAADSYTDLYHRFIEPAKKKSSTLSRLDLLVKKLLLLLTVNELSPEVELHNVDRVKMMMDYLVRCYGVTADQIGNDQAWEIRTEIIRHLAAHSTKGGLTLRGLNDRLKRKKFPTRLVRQTIDDLTTLQIIAATATKGVGRPTVKYSVMEG